MTAAEHIAVWLIVAVSLFAAFGCNDKPPARPAEEPKVESLANPAPISDVEKARLAARKAADDALKSLADGESEVDRLKKEKTAILKDRDLARAEMLEAKTRLSSLDKKLTAKDDEIAEARDRVTQERIYWFAGILGFVSLVAGVVAFAFPLTRSWAGGIAIACGVMSAVAVFAAWLVPYFWWIGGSVVGLAVVGFIVAWKRDTHVGDRLVSTMEKVKTRIPDYKAVLRDELNDIDLQIDRRREKLGLKPKKAK